MILVGGYINTLFNEMAFLQINEKVYFGGSENHLNKYMK